jgi:hypothetical protein
MSLKLKEKCETIWFFFLVGKWIEKEVVKVREVEWSFSLTGLTDLAQV